jgi:Fe-S cluster assembly protein SufD
MFLLNKNYILNNFKLPDTDIIVVLNGEYQLQLSSKISLKINKQALVIPDNVTVKAPIHLLFIASKNCHALFNISVGVNSCITIIEEHASFDRQNYFSKIEINVDAKAKSEIAYYKLQFANSVQSNYQLTTKIIQNTNSKITYLFINKGSFLTTDDLCVKFIGERASYKMRGICLSADKQIITHRFRFEHLMPNCISNILTKGVIDNESIYNFNCRIIIHDAAIKTEARVLNNNLLLSEQAIINSSPEMETIVEDAICTHGVTVGELDQKSLFYLRTRGITKDLAIKILIQAFVQEIAERFILYPRYQSIIGFIS